MLEIFVQVKLALQPVVDMAMLRDAGLFALSEQDGAHTNDPFEFPAQLQEDVRMVVHELDLVDMHDWYGHQMESGLRVRAEEHSNEDCFSFPEEHPFSFVSPEVRVAESF